MKSSSLATVTVGFVSLGVFAALEPVSPVKGVNVALVPPVQKQVMNVPTLKGRIDVFDADNKPGKKTLKHDKSWRKALPLVFAFEATQNERGPWKVLVGKQANLSDARVWYLPELKKDEKEVGITRELELPMANLEIGTRYYWKVVCLSKGKKPEESRIAEFVTEDFAPRWIAIEGRVSNMRDLGGRMTYSGKRVRQGMAFRGQGLNDNSTTGEKRGRNRLMVEDVEYLTQTLGIKTDLDLRSSGETADLKESPLGSDVRLIIRSSSAYKGIFGDHGKRTMAENFREFCKRENYPIYFHCIAGADRTGSLAYVLNGVLGVDRHELETDWESTFYPHIPDASNDPKRAWCRESHFNEGFAKYGSANDSWNRRIELYLLDCGVKQEEIDEFRKIMLEE